MKDKGWQREMYTEDFHHVHKEFMDGGNVRDKWEGLNLSKAGKMDPREEYQSRLSDGPIPSIILNSILCVQISILPYMLSIAYMSLCTLYPTYK